MKKIKQYIEKFDNTIRNDDNVKVVGDDLYMGKVLTVTSVINVGMYPLCIMENGITIKSDKLKKIKPNPFKDFGTWLKKL